jgi:exopolysaccharide biosynthesis polyprenyl glycosylphosphotransferase
MLFHRDNFDALCGLLAGVADFAATYAGVMLAVYLRFCSGLIPLFHEELPPMEMYAVGAVAVSVLLVVIFRLLRLYRRPQTGRFEHEIPRLVRGVGTTLFVSLALTFVAREPDWPPYSRVTALVSFFTVLFLVLLERYILSRIELHWARHSAPVHGVVIVGTGTLAARLRRAIRREPRLRAKVVAHVRVAGEGEPDADIPPEEIAGEMADFEALADAAHAQEIMLATSLVPRERLTEIILYCERRMIPFRMVPDFFDLVTDRVSIEHVGSVPLLGLSRWPLDAFHNRLLKRVEDIAGACVGLLLSAPVFAVAAPVIKLSSPGPVFYRQKRVGANGRRFTMYKLRSMPVDAEKATGPVWTSENDPRRTRVGAFLRRWNLDELPQFWNVLKGDMSLVGPRPERPVFVRKFKYDVDHYMTRHVIRPGMTGWAQVNGLRGNTSISERISHDIYYLENWSLSLDFKILVQTFFRRENAY